MHSQRVEGQLKNIFKKIKKAMTAVKVKQLLLLLPKEPDCPI